MGGWSITLLLFREDGVDRVLITFSGNIAIGSDVFGTYHVVVAILILAYSENAKWCFFQLLLSFFYSFLNSK